MMLLSAPSPNPKFLQLSNPTIGPSSKVVPSKGIETTLQQLPQRIYCEHYGNPYDCLTAFQLWIQRHLYVCFSDSSSSLRSSHEAKCSKHCNIEVIANKNFLT